MEISLLEQNLNYLIMVCELQFYQWHWFRFSFNWFLFNKIKCVSQSSISPWHVGVSVAVSFLHQLLLVQGGLLFKIFCVSLAFSCLNGTEVSFFVSLFFLFFFVVSSLQSYHSHQYVARAIWVSMQNPFIWKASFASCFLSAQISLQLIWCPWAIGHGWPKTIMPLGILCMHLFVISLTWFKNNVVYIMNCFRHH